MRVDLTHTDLVEQVGEIGRVLRVGAGSPGAADDMAQPIVESEQPGPRLAPFAGAIVAILLLAPRPDLSAARHLLVDAVLSVGDDTGEQRQSLAFASLLGEEGGALAAGLLVGRGPGACAEAHHHASRRWAACRSSRSVRTMEPASRAASA